MRKELGVFILLALLCIGMAIFNPPFRSATNMQNLAERIGMFGIFSIGAGFIIITGGIDLSVGSVFAVQGVILAMMLREWHWPWQIAAVGSIVLCMALGAGHGFFVAYVRMQPFIVTLCGLLFYRGAARYLTGDGTTGFGIEPYGFLRDLYNAKVVGVPMPFIILLVVAVICGVLLHGSVYGRYLYAVGKNEEAARYSGINTRLVISSAYVLGLGLAGISGILFAFYTNSISPSTHGNFYELYGIAAAVLGGCSLRGGEGSIWGIIAGVALLQVLRNLVILLGIPQSLEFTVMGAVIFIGVLADQLLTRRGQRRG